MRRLRTSAAAFILLAALVAVARAAEKPVPNLMAGPGCLGVAAQTCVDWLKATMQLDEGFIAAAMARRHRVDVNGRPLGGSGILSLSGRLPGHIETVLVVLRLAADDTVTSAEASLLRNLAAAQTEEDYDHSGLYEVTARLLGRRCPNLVKLELYRFFQNSLKPRIATERQDLSSGLEGLHRLTLHSPAVSYCNASFTYTQQVEWRGSARPEAAAKVTGHASIALQ